MRAVTLTNLIIQLASAADSGKYDHITFNEVAKQMQQKTLVPWMKETLDDMDLSLWNAEDDAIFETAMNDMILAGRIGKSFGVSRKGLPLLTALTTEMVQRTISGKGLTYIQE